MKPLYLTSSLDIAKQQKKNKTFKGYSKITPTHYDYAETIGQRLCLNPIKVVNLLYSLDKEAIKAYMLFFEKYP
jgi:hypothetical protein